MNFQNVLEELERLYDEETVSEKPEEVEEEKVIAEAAEPDSDEADDEEIVIEDDEAEEAEEEVADEVTTFVLECCNCGAVCVKADSEANVDEESGLVNIEEACQYCEATEGYKILGTLNPYAETEASEAEPEAPAEEEAEEEAEESEASEE